MRRDYEEEPDIPTYTGVEEGVQTYWEISHAVKGTRGHSGRYTVGRIFEVLRPLSLQMTSYALKVQSDELAKLVVHGRKRRPSVDGSQVVHLHLVTSNSVQEEIAA